MPQPLYLEEMFPDTYWVGHHVGPSARLDVLCENICYPCWEAGVTVVQCVFCSPSWLLLHLTCIMCYLVMETVLLAAFVCPTPKYQYSYVVSIFYGLQHVCLCTQTFLCRVLPHIQRSSTVHLSQNCWCCVERGCAVVGIPGSCKSMWNKLMLPCSFHCFSS
jgi:hypothetical protein